MAKKPMEVNIIYGPKTDESIHKCYKYILSKRRKELYGKELKKESVKNNDN